MHTKMLICAGKQDLGTENGPPERESVWGALIGTSDKVKPSQQLIRKQGALR